ncbi:MAG: hypothetical protein O2954_06980 [bacterium]|nr:hypothetical protein [bacterium]
MSKAPSLCIKSRGVCLKERYLNKPGRFGLALCLTIFLLSFDAYGDTFAEKLYPLLNLHDLSMTDFAESQFSFYDKTTRPTLSFSYISEDLYREYRNDKQTADFSAQKFRLLFTYRIKISGTVHRFRMGLSWDLYNTQIGHNTTPVRNNLDIGERCPFFEYKVDRKRYGIGLSMYRSTRRGNNQTLRVNKFPHSETDLQMNRMFFDLIEPTFGREIEYNLNSTHLRLQAEGRVRITSRSRAGMAYRVMQASTVTQFQYTNTGEKSELQGRRTTELALNLQSKHIAVMWVYEISERSEVELRTSYTTRKVPLFDLTPESVPESSNGIPLDIEDLADGVVDLDGYEVQVRGQRLFLKQIEVNGFLGFARVNYTGSGSGSTPVLGFRLGFLPISHAADINIRGNTKTWFGKGMIRTQEGKLQWQLDALFAQSYMRNRMRADAELEFGLSVKPFQSTAPHTINLLRIQLQPTLRITQNYHLVYQFVQNIIFINLPHKEMSPLDSRKYRGGRIHGFTLRAYF